MNENEIGEDEYEVTEGGSGMSTAVAMLLGGGITLGIGAGVAALKKAWTKRKAKKEAEVEVVKSEDVQIID